MLELQKERYVLCAAYYVLNGKPGMKTNEI